MSGATSTAIRTRRLAEHLHRLGARALCEFIVELTGIYGDGVLERLEAYSRIDPAILRAVGGDRFPPPALHVVIGRSR